MFNYRKWRKLGDEITRPDTVDPKLWELQYRMSYLVFNATMLLIAAYAWGYDRKILNRSRRKFISYRGAINRLLSKNPKYSADLMQTVRDDWKAYYEISLIAIIERNHIDAKDFEFIIPESYPVTFDEMLSLEFGDIFGLFYSYTRTDPSYISRRIRELKESGELL